MKLLALAAAVLAQDIEFESAEMHVKMISDIFNGKDSQQCHDDYSNENACNADGDCAWCHCAAVPSGCFSVEDAKDLPYPSFDCAKKMAGKDSQECKDAYGDMSSCDADTDCTWCKAAAVPSMCLATEDAGGLPYPSFDCTGFH